MIVTNSISSLSSGLRKSWIPLYPETFLSAIPEKISSLRRLSYLSAFWGVVHPCQILPITRFSFECNQLSTPIVVYDAKNQAAGSVPFSHYSRRSWRNCPKSVLEAARIGTQYVYLKGGRRTLDHLGSYQASR